MAGMRAGNGVEPARPSVAWHRDPWVRGLIWQGLTLVVVVALGWMMVSNTAANLERLHYGHGFGFLTTTAGFDINQTPIAYPKDASYGRALMVGLANTAIVAVIGIVLATIVGFLVGIIPTTLVSAFVEGNILQTLFVSILFGIAMAIVGDPAAPVLRAFDAMSQIVFRLVAILMKAAPIGAFGAFAFTIGAYGISAIANLAALIATFYLTSLIFVLGVLGLVAFFNGFSIFRLVAYLKEELLLVLGTSSSEAALPSLMQKMERAGAAKSVVGLVVPTGYSFNLDGTNIYMTMAALFIAQAMNIDLSLQDQILLLLVAMLSSKGAAGITGAGFITLAATLAVVPSVPIAGMALILGIDRFMSECRALTNFIGNAVATLVVARWEGQLDREAMHLALGSKPKALAAPPDPAAGPGDKDAITAD